MIGRVAEHAEVEGLVRVLPDVFSIHHQILAKSLLKAGMKFIAVAGTQRRGRHAGAARDQRLERGDHRVVASQARQHQVLVERSFHRAGIGNPQHGVGRLEIVGDAEARLSLRGAGQAVVFVEAQAEIEGPVAAA